ncbi:hypothetical protein FIBSPDRAFT_1037149 [Athelia psychrophila]|uniref:G domain-containing protein n=1 Tax=Athelia psychrophila TaxID=1759441 RepID=A0A166UU68_9AGAM|nr:hypothetical protein FIBSPDRAFT_1037149 [Fibularhizoctonia sp. CBS 109695]
MPGQITTEEFTSNDKIIAVMGPPGAGKSTFVAKASGTDEEGVYHDLYNPSCDLRIVRAKSEIDGHPVVFVDAPGFEDGVRPDLEILKLIADCLVKIYHQNIKIAGIVYVHPITKNRMDGTQINSLRIFKSICGDSMTGVTIVSSMWSDINDNIGTKREKELIDEYWREYLDHGCLTKRFHNTHNSAVEIINDMVHSPGITLGLQKEIVEEGKTLPETKAAQAIPSLRAIIKICMIFSKAGWTSMQV